MAGEFFPQGQPEIKALLAALGLDGKSIIEVDFHLRLAIGEIAQVRLSYKELLTKDQLREVNQSLQSFRISESLDSVAVVRDLSPEEKINFREFL